MPKQRTKDPRKAAGGELKHRLILGAARKVFEADGLDRASLRAIAEAAVALGAPRGAARLLVVDTFAHAAGLLLLAHTGRIRMFGASAPARMRRFVDNTITALADRYKRGSRES